jgi:hypothetical protein
VEEERWGVWGVGEDALFLSLFWHSRRRRGGREEKPGEVQSIFFFYSFFRSTYFVTLPNTAAAAKLESVFVEKKGTREKERRRQVEGTLRKKGLFLLSFLLGGKKRSRATTKKVSYSMERAQEGKGKL